MARTEALWIPGALVLLVSALLKLSLSTQGPMVPLQEATAS